MDRYLDTTRHGPMYLRDERIAKIVVTSLHKGVELGQYDLGAYVLMANHVREANLLLGRTGTPFWQAESYDHWVREQSEFDRIRAYIHNNPVHAGLVAKPEDYPWSSAPSNLQ
jgi:putative transposase